MARFLILGAGRQAKAAANFLLRRFSDAAVVFVDMSEAALERACAAQPDHSRVQTRRMAVAPVSDDLRRLIAEADVAISCLPFFHNVGLTELAIAERTHFCDLGGNKDTVFRQLELHAAAEEAGVSIVPDCGLAPGSLNVFAEYWQGRWTYRRVRMYCGGLPQHPVPPLNYALTFSPWGLFNEYFDDCEVARDGRVVTVPGLSEPETLLDLPLTGSFEAFMTSGGTSVGARVYAARGIDYQYKTLRYPGHRDLMAACRQMGLFDMTPRPLRVQNAPLTVAPADINGQILETVLQSDGRDLVVARAEVEGICEGHAVRGRVDMLDYAGGGLTAMERTTGFSVAIVAAAQAGCFADQQISPGSRVPFQVLNPQLLIEELGRGGIGGIAVHETVTPPACASAAE